MTSRSLPVVASLTALVISTGGLEGQVIRGPTEHTTCPTPFRPFAGLTFHGGYAWAVTYHTFPYQFGFAQYSAIPDPAISDDGRATWSNPGAYVECTNTWWFNPDGSVNNVEFRWHIISYRGDIRENSSECGGDGGDWGGNDPIYVTSYDPYVAEQVGAGSVQDCGGGEDGGGADGSTLTCWWEWLEIEISYDGGKTWHPFWSGWGRVCQEQAA